MVQKEKEIKAKEHLEETAEITRHLSYNNIKMMKIEEKQTKETEQKIEEKEHKERQD